MKQAYQHISDAELLAKHQQSGNKQWLGILLERYTGLLFGTCMKYLKNEEQAKDAVQFIYLKVLDSIHKYQVQFFKSWLYMLTKNYCLQLLQTKKTEVLNTNEWAIEQEEDWLNKLLHKEKQLELLEQSITLLNREQQQCIALFYLQKKSYGEIVSITNFTQLQVKSYIQNGKRNLKLMMENKMKTW